MSSVIVPISTGIVPPKTFLERFKISKLVKLEKPTGISPLKRFEDKSNISKFSKLTIDWGKGPSKLLFAKRSSPVVDKEG
jgi:hypothetical protein